MLAVALALGSSVCYGVSNFVGPQLARRHTTVAVLVISQLAALLGCVILVGADGGATPPLDDFLLGVLAGIGNAIGLVTFYKAAELGPLAIVAPIGATGAIVPVAYGVATGDALAGTQVAGLVLAVGGAVLAARSQSSSGERRVYADPRASAIWAGVSAVAFGTFLTALPKASAGGRYWALFDARAALVLLLVVWAWGRLHELRIDGSKLLLTTPGLLLLAGTLLYVVASEHGLLSLVSVLGSLFPVVTVALGVAVLGERIGRLQATGVFAALVGVVLIAA